MVERKKKRKYGKNDGVFALSRKFTLTPISHGEANLDDPWVDPAWDGHRVLATRMGAQVRLAASDFRDWTTTFPAAAAALGKLGSSSIAIDGMICVFDEHGKPSFDTLRRRYRAVPP